MPYVRYNGSLAAETLAPAVNFYGSNVVETLSGSAAAEGFWGTNDDLLAGGAGDDTYYLQGSRITVSEAAGGGTDRIVAWANVNLAEHPYIENLQIGGDRTYGAGNGLDNVIVATGRGQQLYGAGGQDVLVGGAGADTFIIIKGTGSDAIHSFDPSQDVVRLTADLTSFAQVQARMAQVGADVRVDLGDGEGLVFRNLAAGQLTAANFQLRLDASKLGAVSFHDEFSGPLSLYHRTYNPNGVWRPDFDWGANGVGSYTLPTNNEQQIYTSPYFRDHAGDFAESAFVSNGDGTLSIWARPSSNPELFGYHFTSGMLSSKDRFAQTYGYFEMRADLPENDGGWPAFWLLPANRSWPPELDVMEVLTKDPNATWTSAHSAASGGHAMSQALNFIPDTTDGFHTYGLLWTKTDLTWYIDGVEVFRTATSADHHQPMYMIANLALGGWGGAIDPAQMPAEMRIDYIRAYQLADGASSVAQDKVGSGGGALPPQAPSPPAASSGGGGGAGSPAATARIQQGGDGADTLTGPDARNTMFGGDGADRIVGGRDFNQVNGNKGADTISGKSQVGDWLLGGQGDDQIDASQSSGRNILNGNMGRDVVIGGAGADTLRGGQGDDDIVGGAGDDWIFGDRGTDFVAGGAGADTFHHFAGAGVTTILDFNRADGDVLKIAGDYSYAQRGGDVVVALSGGGEMVLHNAQLSTLGSGWILAG